MNEVIGSILEAEKQAEQIIDAANIKAKADIAAADTNALRIKEDAVVKFKNQRKAVMEDAETRASKEYDAIILQEKEKTALMIKNAEDKIEAVVTKTIGRINF